MKKSINIQGINTLPNHQDGECSQVVNARWENGALVPAHYSGYKDYFGVNLNFIVKFVNENEVFFLGVKHYLDTNTSRIYLKGNGDIKFFETNNNYIEIPDIVYSIEKIGNTMVFLAAATKMFARIISKKEAVPAQIKYLGELPEQIVMDITTANVCELQNIPIKNSNWLEMQTFQVSEFDRYNPASLLDVVEAQYNKLIAQYKDNNNKLCLSDAHFVRWAYKLYDGSYVKLSPPILIMPPSSVSRASTAQFYYSDNTNDSDTAQHFREKKDSKLCSFYFHADKEAVNEETGYRLLNENTKFENPVFLNVYDIAFKKPFSFDNDSPFRDEGWGDIINSIDFFISPPLNVNARQNYRTDIVPDTLAQL
ncbi:MAG: hypothetical protein LBB53_03005, partial [Prevotellaceae bacterium]|nr:hypothetical protein [Prevotellaceae bacterium]